MNIFKSLRMSIRAWAIRLRIEVLDEHIGAHEKAANAYALERDGLEVALSEIRHQQARARV